MFHLLIEFFLDEHVEKIKSLATQQELTFSQLIEIEKIDGHVYELFVLDKEGNVIATTNPEEEIGTDFSTADFFLNGKKQIYFKDITQVFITMCGHTIKRSYLH